MSRTGEIQLSAIMDAYIVEGRQWFDTLELRSMSPEAIAILSDGASALAESGLQGEIIVVPHGRGRNPDVPSALPIGQAGSSSIVTGVYWQDAHDDEAAESWSHDVITRLRDGGHALDGMYGNMASPVDVKRDRQSYGEQAWNRLTALKAEVDSDNVFHLNHNIPPSR